MEGSWIWGAYVQWTLTCAPVNMDILALIYMQTHYSTYVCVHPHTHAHTHTITTTTCMQSLTHTTQKHFDIYYTLLNIASTWWTRTATTVCDSRKPNATTNDFHSTTSASNSFCTTDAAYNSHKPDATTNSFLSTTSATDSFCTTDAAYNSHKPDATTNSFLSTTSATDSFCTTDAACNSHKPDATTNSFLSTTSASDSYSQQ